MSSRYFVNLPARQMTTDEGYLEYFIENEINPEVGLDLCWDGSFSLKHHKELARRISSAGLACTVHLPFTDLQPGSLDDLIRRASRERLRQALEAAEIYEPRVMVAHAALNVIMYSREFYPQWLELSARTWTSCLDRWPGHPHLAFENTHEPGPGPILDLIDAVSRRTESDRIGMCLDIGHWHSFARGQVMNNLWNWLEEIAGRTKIFHMHLHDNDGSADQHLGLGAGSIPFAELFSGLRQLNQNPTLTLEPHSESDLTTSQLFIAAHPEWFPNRLAT